MCRESALRAKHDEQNVKVRNWGEVGALWRRTEAKARSTVQIVEDGGRALCGATEDGGAAAEQVAVHLRSPDMHPSIHACTRIPHAHDPEDIDYHFLGIG